MEALELSLLPNGLYKLVIDGKVTGTDLTMDEFIAIIAKEDRDDSF